MPFGWLICLVPAAWLAIRRAELVRSWLCGLPVSRRVLHRLHRFNLVPMCRYSLGPAEIDGQRHLLRRDGKAASS